MITETSLLGCRILIVEDDYNQARDIQQLLELAGAQIVVIAGQAPDLVSLVGEARVDAGLIDINLGQGLSFALARALREHAIPFVFLTGYDASVVPEDLADAPYLRKPAATKRIIEALSIIATSRN